MEKLSRRLLLWIGLDGVEIDGSTDRVRASRGPCEKAPNCFKVAPLGLHSPQSTHRPFHPSCYLLAPLPAFCWGVGGCWGPLPCLLPPLELLPAGPPAPCLLPPLVLLPAGPLPLPALASLRSTYPPLVLLLLPPTPSQNATPGGQF
jgi:hypothetical protein